MRADTAELRAVVRAELIPFIAQLGFRRAKRSLAVRPSDKSFSNTFQRRWGDHLDELNFQWLSSGRPHFAINFWTDQTDKMVWSDANPQFAASTFHERVPSLTCSWVERLSGRPLDTWYGQATDVARTIAVAKARLLDLDNYLRYDIPLDGLVPGNGPVMTKADPEIARTIKEHAPLINTTPPLRPKQPWRRNALRLTRWEAANHHAARVKRR